MIALSPLPTTGRRRAPWPLPPSVRAETPASPGDALAFCRRVLPSVSRTFALNIPMLPPPLDDAVTIVYLLCRIADTLEDEGAGDIEALRAALTEFNELCALPPGWFARSQRFAQRAAALLRTEAPEAEVLVLLDLPTVLIALSAMPRAVQLHGARCLDQMTRGMAVMLRAEPTPPAGPLPLRDLAETFEYCQYVAGTVGEMLTGLFAWHAPSIASARAALGPNVESFGRALQLTNVIKDIREDLDAGRCWLPGDVLARHGFRAPVDLCDPTRRAQAVAMLDELVGVAHREAIHAFEYALAIPAEQDGIRRFCLTPLFLAVLTLRELHGNPEVFDADRRVKIRRNAVKVTVVAVRGLARRDAALRALFATATRGLPLAAETREAALPVPEREPEAAIAAAMDVLGATQSPSGSWRGAYDGPLFLLPMHVGTWYVLGKMPDEATRADVVRYLTAHQNPDGGFGLDVESHSVVFTTVLNYVALRLLGVSADDPRTAAARAWLLAHGGATMSASWGKFFLAVLGLYAYEGLDPLPPELWLLPEAAPVHPSRLWCHARMIYLPMSWLYGRRASAAPDPLLTALRDELYTVPYAEVDWRRARSQLAATDAYTPHHLLLRAAHAAMHAYERRPSSALRERALERVLQHIRYEDEVTHYRCIGPVNKVLNALVWHFVQPGGEEVKRHVETLPTYLWRSAEGTRVQGYDSSELWDTAFAVQAMTAAGPSARRETLARAAEYIEQNQVLEDPPERERFYRHRARGGWPFSTREHGWPISDCTAEGLKAVFALDALELDNDVTPERRAAAIDLILSWQNADGGWATYENTRGPRWLERLNPAHVFGDIMVDYSYVECTSACVQALRLWAERNGSGDPRIARAIARGEKFLLKQQRPDGSWEGSWGVCFTYGTWFGVWGLADSRDPRARKAIERACAFLEKHQLEDGGWGETVESCRLRRYVHAETGQAVMTSWALLALARAGRQATPAVRRGVDFLLRRQEPDGRWPEEHIAGVFNKTSAIHYDTYLRVFPLWALALCTSERRPGS